MRLISYTTPLLAGVAIAQNGASCPDYALVTARGTGEPQGPSLGFSGLGIGGMAPQTLAAVPNGVEYDVVYPASAAPNSEAIGGADAVRYINASRAACPNQKFALLGYSQAATIMLEALQAYQADNSLSAQSSSWETRTRSRTRFQPSTRTAAQALATALECCFTWTRPWASLKHLRIAARFSTSVTLGILFAMASLLTRSMETILPILLHQAFRLSVRICWSRSFASWVCEKIEGPRRVCHPWVIWVSFSARGVLRSKSNCSTLASENRITKSFSPLSKGDVHLASTYLSRHWL